MIRFLFLLLFVGLSYSFAAGMPWEGPLKTVQDSLSGPVAKSIAVLAVVAAGGILIWGGELSKFVKTIVYVVLVASIIVFASTFIESAGIK